MIRLGMIGTGKIVHMFAQAALKSGNYHLEAVCSRDKERGKAFAKEYGISQVTVSLEELAEIFLPAPQETLSPEKFRTLLQMPFLSPYLWNRQLPDDNFRSLKPPGQTYEQFFRFRSFLSESCMFSS